MQYYGGTISNATTTVGGSPSAWSAFGISYYNATGRKVVFVQTAVGATGQTDRWCSTCDLYLNSIATLNSALSALTVAGYAPSVKGVLWNQGETDATAINSSTETATQYATAFRAMIAAYRTNISASLPFYIFRTGKHTGAASIDVGYGQIRNAQDSTVISDNLTSMAYRGASTFIDRSLMNADGIHYSQDGLNEMGRIGGANVASSFQHDFFQKQKYSSNIFFPEGNVSIGSSTEPAAPLVVSGSQNYQFLLSGTPSTAYTQMYLQGTGRSVGLGIGNANESAFNVANKFFIYSPSTPTASSSMQFVIDQNSNTGISSTTPWRTLSVGGSMAISGLTANSGSNYAVCINGSTKEVTADVGGACNTSSMRFKDDIQALTVSALDIVSTLKPSTFKYLNASTTNYGLIAEDVASSDSHLATYEQDGTTPHGLDTNALISVLVKSIQELREQVRELQIKNGITPTETKSVSAKPVTESAPVVTATPLADDISMSSSTPVATPAVSSSPVPSIVPEPSTSSASNDLSTATSQ